MYNKSSFINDDGTDVLCVIKAVKDVRVDENVQTKFIKIVII